MPSLHAAGVPPVRASLPDCHALTVLMPVHLAWPDRACPARIESHGSTRRQQLLHEARRFLRPGSFEERLAASVAGSPPRVWRRRHARYRVLSGVEVHPCIPPKARAEQGSHRYCPASSPTSIHGDVGWLDLCPDRRLKRLTFKLSDAHKTS